MMFSQLTRARLTYAILMATCASTIMSAVSTSVLRPMYAFWNFWPKVLMIDLLVAIPVAILLGPVIRRICRKIFPSLPN
jgi:hypothetical protein